MTREELIGEISSMLDELSSYGMDWEKLAYSETHDLERIQKNLEDIYKTLSL